MTTFIFPKDDRNKTAKIQPKKGDTYSVRVDFDDLHVIPDGDAVHCFAHVVGCDAVQLKDKEVKFPETVYFKVSKSEANICENFIYDQLKELKTDGEKPISGFLSINEGMGFDRETLELISAKVYSATELDGERQLKPSELKAPAGGSGKTYKSPLERAQEKLSAAEFVIKDPRFAQLGITLVAEGGQPLTTTDYVNLLTSIL
ncbi:MAG: hypothetical protein AAGF93_05470 [Cyanobacteria bacterium P01_H01_bin.105]